MTAERPPTVLVVGAGPTGLTAACELLRQGVAVRIVDSAPDRIVLSRAIGVQPRTLELFASRGLADDLVECGGAISRVVRHARGFPPATIRLDTGVADTRFSQILFLSQTETERVLLDELARLGGRVERGVELVGLRQQSDAVTVRLHDRSRDEGTDTGTDTDLHPGTDPGSDTELTVSHVVGADGAASTVRGLLGLGFPGRTYRQSFVVADVAARGRLDPRALNIFLEPHGRGQVGFMPLGADGGWRMLAMETRDIDQDTPEPTLDEVTTVAREITRGAVSVSTASWISRFRIHLRSVERFRVGRVFLAGDAAHTHSPAGGQGMNTGIGDAWNLAWKIGYVVRGMAPDSLLDSYQAERRPVAEQILATSDRAFQGFVAPNPVLGWLRGWLVPMITTLVGVLPGASGRAARAFSQLDIGYPRSPVVGGRADLPGAPGMRLPDVELADGRRLHGVLAASGSAGHHLVVCSAVDDAMLERVVGPYRDIVTVVRVPDGTLGGGAVLVRPDGHVGFRVGGDPAGAGLDALAAHLARMFTVSGRSR